MMKSFLPAESKYRGSKINGMSDHVHFFIKTRPSLSLSNLMKVVKDAFPDWIPKPDQKVVLK